MTQEATREHYQEHSRLPRNHPQPLHHRQQAAEEEALVAPQVVAEEAPRRRAPPHQAELREQEQPSPSPHSPVPSASDKEATKSNSSNKCSLQTALSRVKQPATTDH